MKRIFTLNFLLICFVLSMNAQVRYLEETFTDVEVEKDIVYGANASILQIGDPAVGIVKQPLRLDLYTPAGDTETDRPIILVFHTGNFLPPLVNGQINGAKNDPYLVEIVERLTRLGYVVASVTYRLGWNPISDDQEVRTNTLINAAYRGVQDASTCARFFRKSVEEGNPYGINAEQMVAWGVGTGGYISLAATTLDEYTDVVIPKFFGKDINGDGNPDPMVIEAFNGDPKAETKVGLHPVLGDTLCYINHPGYSSEFQLSVNMGGALGDSSWIDAGDTPLISFHTIDDPNAPYLEDILKVPTTGDLVVEVQGAGINLVKANELGINAPFADGIFDDEFTARANSLNGGNEGLFPLERPYEQSGPWDWWDADFWAMSQPQQCTDGGIPLDQCNWHLLSLMDHPQMSFALASTYNDTILGYFAPRACLTLGLESCSWLFTDTDEVVKDEAIVTLSPNPTLDRFTLTTNAEIIQNVEIFDVNAKLVQSIPNINNTTTTINVNHYNTGMYYVKANFEDGIVVKKLMIE